MSAMAGDLESLAAKRKRLGLLNIPRCRLALWKLKPMQLYLKQTEFLAVGWYNSQQLILHFKSMVVFVVRAHGGHGGNTFLL